MIKHMPKPPVGADEYRDDRQFVMNLVPRKDGQWLLTTYENTGALPPFKTHVFPTLEHAQRYVKAVEPTTPLTSLDGKGLPFDSEFDEREMHRKCVPYANEGIYDSDVEERYDVYVDWLASNDWFSALEDKVHVAYFVDSRGWKEGKEVIDEEDELFEIDGVEIRETPIKY